MADASPRAASEPEGFGLRQEAGASPPKSTGKAGFRLNCKPPSADGFRMPTAAPSAPVVIRPQTGWPSPGLGELWRYRELVGFLALRDLKVRYKQSALGAAWALLQPLLTLAVFSGLFAALLGPQRMPGAPGVPYAVSTFCALVPWQLFARGVVAGGDSVVVNQALVTKVYFPRLAVPIAPLLAALVDAALAFAVLIGMLVWAGIAPGAALAALPLLVLLTLAAALGASLWLAAVNALYRDVRIALPFLVQIGMLATPVVYTAADVLEGRPAWLAFVYALNPMAGVVEGFRWSLLGSGPAPVALLALSALVTACLLVSGLLVFRRLERDFADRV
jgi:lipopolysaccharide transport system permease protein